VNKAQFLKAQGLVMDFKLIEVRGEPLALRQWRPSRRAHPGQRNVPKGVSVEMEVP
jgi:hypothetical protein